MKKIKNKDTKTTIDENLNFKLKETEEKKSSLKRSEIAYQIQISFS